MNKKEIKVNKEDRKKGSVKKHKLNSSAKFTILALVVIAIFSISLSPVTLQNDTYYTIKIGEHITNYGIDMKDPFSWHQDLAYTYPHWLYDLITYNIYSAFGMQGIYITTCILSAILGISIYLVNTKLAKNQILSFFITLGAMYMLRNYIAARAQLVTFILFILTIFFIEKFLENKKKRYAIGLIIIPILIANLHLAVFPFYFILYLPYIGEYLIAVLGEIVIYRKVEVAKLKRKILKLKKQSGNNEKVKELEAQLEQLEEKIDKIKVKRTKELKNPYKIRLVKNNNVKWLILVMIVCMFTGFLTPLGTTPYTYLIKTVQGNTTQNINEHLPMTLANEKEVLCALVIFIGVLFFTKVKIRLNDLFMISGLFYLMIATKRQVTMFVIMGSVVLNRIMTELFEIYSKESLEESVKRISTKIGTTIIIVFMLILSCYMGKDKLDDKFIDNSLYPVEACDYILKNIDLGQARFYNEYNYGSYMLFRGVPVFIDSRADLYAPEFSGKKDDIFKDFIDTSGISKFYEDTFKKYNITHAIMYKNSKINLIIEKTKDPNYKKIYEDAYFIIYQRLNV